MNSHTLFTFVALASTAAYAGDGTERFVRKLSITPDVTAVVAESELEARSTGSFYVNLYSGPTGEKGNETTFFTGGVIHKRDGTIEDVLKADVDRDGTPEIVVVVRCAGSGGYLSAHAFSIGGAIPDLAASADELARDADPVQALRQANLVERSVPTEENGGNREIRYLVIQPVTVRDDEGGGSAQIRLYEKQISEVFRQAGVEVVWLAPTSLDSTASRDGQLTPDAIVKLGRDRQLWGQGTPRINLIFVNAIQGQTGPRGLGMTPGPICFVALPPEVKDPEMEAFCIIHEMSHCLGLIHAVDDPQVDDDVPSIMGDGAFAERIGQSALQPAHIATIRASRLVLRPNQP